MDIDTMPAGREIDALIAEKIFKHTVVVCDPTGYNYKDNIGPCLSDVPRDEWDEMPYAPLYSTNIAAAWEVVELFRRGQQSQPERNSVACVVELVVIDCCTPEDCICSIYSPSLAKAVATANQMPLAICRAALKTQEPEQDEKSDHIP